MVGIVEFGSGNGARLELAEDSGIELSPEVLEIGSVEFVNGADVVPFVGSTEDDDEFDSESDSNLSFLSGPSSSGSDEMQWDASRAAVPAPTPSREVDEFVVLYDSDDD